MKARHLFPIIAVLFLLPATAQDKLLTLEDAVYMNPDIFPKSLRQLQWMGSSDNLCWNADGKLVVLETETMKRDTLDLLDDINAGLTDLGVDSLKQLPPVNFFEDEFRLRFVHLNRIFIFDRVSKNLLSPNRFPEKAEHSDLCIVNQGVAYTIGNNLYIALDNEEIQVTHETDPGIVCGQTVHRVEFGIDKGTFWSPGGNYLAFYRKDERMVNPYPLVDIDQRIATVKETKYPMAGMTSEEVTVGIFNLERRETVFMKTGQPADQYLTCITWDPSEKFIYIALLNRDQNHLKLKKYDASTGDEAAILFEEEDEQYVEPLHPLYFLNTFPDRFIWLSRRDGYNQLYLYNTRGELLRQLTSNRWEVTGMLGLDEKDKRAYFTGTGENPLEQHIFSVEVKSGEQERLSTVHGTHIGDISHSGQWMVDSYSSTEVAREIRLTDTGGKNEVILLPDEDPLRDYAMGETTTVTLQADDGTPLYGRLIKPPNPDPGMKYPVFLYVYGGPHSQLVTDSWTAGAGLFLNYMAQQGYVVFTLDNRGTSNRGLEFEQAIFRNLGTMEVADQMKGVEYLKSLEFVDPERIGVNGWSYGGFMTVSMMLRYPEVFKAACAGGPVVDWKYYEVMYGERYMDTPESNPDGYKNASLLNYVDHLNGRLLIIHGTMDATVVWQNSLAFLKKCIDEGKQVDYFVYPGHEHNIRGKDRKHLYEKIRIYFDEYLK
ncbi:MAG: DPP IV N-terminal domain-containing protein [Bacteroidales bacterium]|nr:DPP IV N-terminal domain-containing protein [Bacteroidales bacterium]